MKKEIFVNETASERRIAIVEDSVLVEFYVEKPHHQGMVGNIYKGRVENVLPGMQAAFVDIGYEVNAFLPFSEISNPEYLKDTSTSDDDNNDEKKIKNQNKEIDVELETGQEILVQVIKEPFSGKGPRATTNIAIPGHLMVLVPNTKFIGVSKKIWDKYEKRRLRKIVRHFAPDNTGIIVRTEAEGKSEKVLKKDFDMIIKSWKVVEDKAQSVPASSLIYEDYENVSSIMRDVLTADVDRVAFDSRKLYRRTQSYLQNVSPELASQLEMYRGRIPLLEREGIENDIEKSTRRRVWMKSGAYLIIEQTEAMVVIDVNSGRFVGKKDHEQNSLSINLEASREIARQLRLRDIGGLIVIDFIDMKYEKNKMKVYQEIRSELRKDRAKVAVSPISDFGLLEMTRQRIRLSLLHSLRDECPTCGGSGHIASKDAVITKIENWLKQFRNQSREIRLKLTIHPTLKEYLKSSKKDIIRRFMWKNFMHIEVVEDDSLLPDEFRFYSRKSNREITDEV